jgi:hypothetical protein
VPHVQVPFTAPAGTSQSPEQHSTPYVQLPPVQTHVGVHAPLVAPGGMTQNRPTQQSTLAVHAWPGARQSTGGAQIPPTQAPVQHSASLAHAAPFGAHPGATHRRSPAASGRQDPPSQHCSLN